MKSCCCLQLIATLLILFGARVGAATDPVYVVVGADGRPSLSNHSDSMASKLMLAGHSEEVLAFRKRFRITSDVAYEPTRLGSKIKSVPPEIASMIDAAATRSGLSSDFVKAVILVESGFRPTARSSAGAVGLMQVIPATGRRFGVSDLYDPAANLHAGTTYLAYLLKYFNGDVRLALAGYNAGEGAVKKHGFRIPPYPETQAYVPAVLAAWRSFDQRSASGKQPAPLANSP
jgi:Transglycosylase SLT domain